MRDADSNESAISVPPITAWIACGNGPLTRTTDDSITEPAGALNCGMLPVGSIGVVVGVAANIDRNDDIKPPPSAPESAEDPSVPSVDTIWNSVFSAVGLPTM